MLKRIINLVVWIAISLYLSVSIILHIPVVQSFLGERVSSFLSHKFGTKVYVGRVDLGFINRLIIDDVNIFDNKNVKMLKIGRLSLKVDPIELANGRTVISSLQFFGLKANLYKENAKAKPNFQFVIDSLASKDKSPKKPIDLRINSIIIRNSNIKYRQLDVAPEYGRFSPQNINATNISTHIILDRFSNGVLDLKAKRIAFNEQSGLKVKRLSFKIHADKSSLLVSDFKLQLPNSDISSVNLNAHYAYKEGHLYKESLSFAGEINANRISPADLSCFNGIVGKIKQTFGLHGRFSGTGNHANIKYIRLYSNDGSFRLKTTAEARLLKKKWRWNVNVTDLFINQDELKYLSNVLHSVVKLPEALTSRQYVNLKLMASGYGKDLKTYGQINTDAGRIECHLSKIADNLSGNISTRDFNLSQVANDDKFGKVTLNLKFNSKKGTVSVIGDIPSFDYSSYNYKNIKIDGSYSPSVGYKGFIGLNDPNGQIELDGMLQKHSSKYVLDLDAKVREFSPSEFHLSNKWPDTRFSFDTKISACGTNIQDIVGRMSLDQFMMKSKDTDYSIANLSLSASHKGHERTVEMNSDFGKIDLSGKIDFKSLASSFIHQVKTCLPTLPIETPKYKISQKNRFKINADIHDTEWMKHILGIPLSIQKPLRLHGYINDNAGKMSISCDAPSLSYKGNKYEDLSIEINSAEELLTMGLNLKKVSENGRTQTLKINSNAQNNRLSAEIGINDNKQHPFRGQIKANAQFFNDEAGLPTADIRIDKSEIFIGDSVWHVTPAQIVYNKKGFSVDGFSIKHSGQYISVSGTGSRNSTDSLVVDLKGIDVAYILNLVNFHSVDFSGLASGRAFVSDIYSSHPQAGGRLKVDDFRFEGGRMGTLDAFVDFDSEASRINISAVANDSTNRQTDIRGYVSPGENFIDLGITARKTRAEFVESFCGSFMDNVNVDADGSVRLSGPLNEINLTGQLVVNGSLSITSLNTTYTLDNDTIRFIPNEIVFNNDSIYDRNGNLGIVKGRLHHEHLTNLSYDMNVKAENLLAYDTHASDDASFYGTVFATGNCNIKGKSGIVTIDVEATPENGSYVTYSINGQNTLQMNEFINWKVPSTVKEDTTATKPSVEKEMSTDIFLNFLINCTPEATLKVIMDSKSGDYVSLNGNGTLRASYYNKGSFDIFGNYEIDHGIYKLTIQNLLKREFQFQHGGTIKFGGDPFDAALDLKALYVLNSVSLSDLSLGRSFSNNNTRVNCLMDVTGTPSSPKVNFNIDMPTLGTDAKQMVYSIINAEEEMNQQVLYLLAVGRFYNGAENNSAMIGTTAQHNQTSLAMQSILSGTISQQLNTVLSNVVNNKNWNFGANISTGTEGFHDAEYEGLLSGRLLNNRLLLNGQFGYRDNANAMTSFIGDFDLRYLLFPSGNMAITVYNKANDRYFTRNSLNTQGIGIIMKKDFNSLYDLIRPKRTKKAFNKKKSSK